MIFFAVVSQAGHTGPGVSKGLYTLEDQISHKIKFLTNVKSKKYDLIGISKTTKIEFVLLGHSIGAYINLRV